jgi:hypothetical protein
MAIRKKTPSLPTTIFVSAAGWRALKGGYGPSVSKLTTRMAKADLKDAPEAGRALAENVATALAELKHSSDADCKYYGLVFGGVDVADDLGFFEALGTHPEATVDTCDGEDQAELETWWAVNPKRKTVPKPLSVVDAFVCLDEDEDIGEYYSQDEQEALRKAGKALAGTGAVVGGRFLVDRVTSVLFVVGKIKNSLWAGALTARIDT